MKRDTAVDISSSNKFNRTRTGSTNEFNTYIDYLIQENITDIDNWEHREARVAFDPLINAWVCRRIEETFGPGFRFKDEEGKKEIKNLNTRKAHTGFEEYELDAAVKEAAELWVTHGWSFICQFIRNGDYYYRVFSIETLRNWQADQLVQSGDIKKDAYGFPVAIRVPRKPGDYEGIVVREKFFIFINIGTKRSQVFPDTHLRPVWDRAINFVESLYSQKNFMCYFALIPFMRMPPGTSNAEQNKMRDNLKYSRFGERAIVARGKKDDVDFEMKGGAGVMPDFPSNLMAEIQAFAAPTGYPARWFLGDPKGALEAAGQDDIVVVKKHEALFAKWGRIYKKIFVKFLGVNPEFRFTLESNIKERETDKDKWEKEKLKGEAVMGLEVAKFNEQREMAGLEEDPKYKDKYYFEIIAEQNSQFNMQVSGLDQPNEKGSTSTPQKDPKPAGPQQKDSLLEKWDSKSQNEKMSELNAGKATVKKVDEYLHDLNNGAHIEDHDLTVSLKTDSLVENEECYVIDCHLFDGNVPLQYIRDSEIVVERNPPDEIQKWVIANKGKEIPLGVEHEDGITVEKNKVGYIIPLGFNGHQDVSKAYIYKDKIKGYSEFERKIKAKESIDLSGCYRSKDIISKMDGIDWDHTNFEVRSAVLTEKGRCGPTCALQPQGEPSTS
jgi:hypothetical protein